jgi:pyruvate dehydrogenase E2 component (dihydrolipoamide acetyltransferase)
LTPADQRDGVFTITNLGSFGIDAFTPIINLPQTSILGMGAIRREPVVLDDGQMAALELIWLSLTFDHRVVDGAPAARFLQTLSTAIENPSAWLPRSQ